MIVDSHCHLDDPKIYNQLENIVNRAKVNNVKCLLTISTTLSSFKKIELIVEKYPSIYGTFGIHPHETKDNKEINSAYISNLVKNKKKIIGVGETGLDYYYEHSDKKVGY